MKYDYFIFIYWCYNFSSWIKVIMFEEQEGDYKVYFEDTPDLGMAADLS